MIKSIHNLTESDKRKFYEAAKADYIRNYDAEWAVIENGMKTFIVRLMDAAGICKDEWKEMMAL